MTEKYSDIINLSHHVSAFYPHMPVRERAAQFAPFAALNGYEEAVRETARITGSRRELEEDEKAVLDRLLSGLALKIEEKPEVLIGYFVPDEFKSGGTYRTVSGKIKRIEEHEQIIIMDNGVRICIKDIDEIEYNG